MKNLFEIIYARNGDKNEEPSVCIGIRIKIGARETICPLSGPAKSHEALEADIGSIKENLDMISKMARDLFNTSSPGTAVELNPDMGPEEIWKALSTIGDEEIFLKSFNGLEEGKRKEIADYVLTRCNIFSGKGAVFSSLYDSESGLLR